MNTETTLVTSNELDTHPAELTSKSARLSTADILRVLDYTDQGLTQKMIAEIIGCSQSSVSRTLADAARRTDSLQKLMTAGIAEKLEHWDTAAAVAALRGDHRPAREYIEMAKPELRPQPAAGAGVGGVAIFIGQAGSPLSPPDIAIQALSPAQLTPSSEGPQK